MAADSEEYCRASKNDQNVPYYGSRLYVKTESLEASQNSIMSITHVYVMLQGQTRAYVKHKAS